MSDWGRVSGEPAPGDTTATLTAGFMGPRFRVCLRCMALLPDTEQAADAHVLWHSQVDPTWRTAQQVRQRLLAEEDSDHE